MKRIVLTVTLLGALIASNVAQTVTTISEFNLAGPYPVQTPVFLDSVGVGGKPFDKKSLLGALSLKSDPTGTFSGSRLPSLADKLSVGVLSFYINNSDYLKGSIIVKGPKNYKVYVDGREGSDLKLAPEHHTVSIRYLAEPNDTDSISVSLSTQHPVVPTLSKRHPYMVHDLTDGRRVRSLSLSADGQLVMVGYQTTERDGQSVYEYELRQLKGDRLLSRLKEHHEWMPRSIAYIDEQREASGGRTLYKVDPFSGQRTKLVSGVPRGSYDISPNEEFLIISQEEEGPKEDKDVFEVIEMDDRQPNWRKRSYLSRIDFSTGLTQRLTFGNQNEQMTDISADGSKLLIMRHHSRLTKRPTTVSDVLVIDALTLVTDTLLKAAEFVDDARFSPDGRKVLFRGSPEAFGRIGCQLPESVTPSMTENELFLFDIATKQVTPLTRDFDPSIARLVWSRADGNIYFTAEDRDYVRLYQLNPKTGKTVQLPAHGVNVSRLSLANEAPVLAYLSYDTMAPASAYVLNAKTSSQQQLFDGATALGDAEVGTCQDWNFTNSNGDTVYGRLYLPRDFDETKKYPMIVYYYGGCSPSTRYFESPYAPQYWNSLGYVAYILQPSGATGFGQEWASRHVNTAGRGPADDIIEGTKQICREHPFIDATHIGCMGASYGGFMTQYLQTQTDIFAAAVSHAGITNHTSYWGVGYWGYNYSEVSMANSYPWSHRQLYVDQSPLFNADKIHTPLLLLHGNADTNVPLIESLQMFTALKLLGREVALVEVEGENHHILDYGKREKWLATQMAWFQRWLKEDSSWWDALYPKKNL